MALECLGQRMTQYTDLAGKGKTEIPFAEVEVERAALYCGADSATVLALHDHFAHDLEQHKLLPLLQMIEMPLIPVLVDMEWAGIRIDTDREGLVSPPIPATMVGVVVRPELIYRPRPR